MIPKFILASNSPRRRELLSMLGIDFSVIVSDCDETIDASTPPDEMVRELSKRKAQAVADRLDIDGDFIVIGADTIVWDGIHALGKPRDIQNAKEMVMSLSNSTHCVYSGVALIGRIGGEIKTVCDAVKTEVVFDHISDKEAQYYALSKEGLDKAGAYAVQGIAGIYVKELRGDYYNVVGLPIARIRILLEQEFGLCSCDYILKV